MYNLSKIIPKNVLLSIFCITSFFLNGMAQCSDLGLLRLKWLFEIIPLKTLQNMSNSHIKLGDTILHIAVRELESMPQQEILQAKKIAMLIKMGSEVTAPNNKGITPFSLAKKNKQRFPIIFEVMLAGKIVQNWNPYIPPLKHGSVYTWQEILAIVQHPKNQELLTERAHAINILRKYTE